MRRLRHFSFALVLLAGCAESQPALVACPPSGCEALQPPPIDDREPLDHAWGELSLTIAGPAASDRKRDVCRDEARSDGVHLVSSSNVEATLYLGDDGNRVETRDGRPPQRLGQWAMEKVCRAAVATALNVDMRVRTADEGRLPDSCTLIGNATAEDRSGVPFSGVMMGGSFQVALVNMKLEALRRGGNAVRVDAMRQLGPALILDGRVFRCGPDTTTNTPKLPTVSL